MMRRIKVSVATITGLSLSYILYKNTSTTPQLKPLQKSPPQIKPKTRSQLLKDLASEQFDLLVIGGGATGAGCALDACTRGLKVALVEQDDYASGTSSRR